MILYYADTAKLYHQQVAEKPASTVTPAEAGVQNALKRLDSRSLLNTCRDKLREGMATNGQKGLFQHPFIEIFEKK